MKKFDVARFRQHFPVLTQTVEGHPLVYFDNAATMQKPNSVIDSEVNYYQKFNANVHRASHHLSTLATTRFEQARSLVKSFINAEHSQEIIWTKGTTESINLVAQSWGMFNLSKEDEIVVSYAEHHANIVPWQEVANKTGAKLKVLPLDAEGRIDENQLHTVISSKTKLVCSAHISNVIGKINPIEKVIAKAKSVGAKTLIDGAQAIAHLPVDVRALDCDFYVFSAHKAYGPTGVGVLYGKRQLLDEMPPYQLGGEMIKTVSFSGTTYNQLPFKFEAGTPNIAGVIGFAQAIEFMLSNRNFDEHEYKQELVNYCYQQLSIIEGVKFIVQGKPDLPLFSFTISSAHQQDIAAELDIKGVAVRVGHHCAMPLMGHLKINGCIRLSLALYNTKAEIDFVIQHLKTLLVKEGKSTGVNNDEIPCSNSGKTQGHQAMLDKFNPLTSWDSKHREIMLLGKSFKRMDKVFRDQQSLISGCESAAWLKVEKSEEGYFYIHGDSDAKIIRGLMAIVFSAFNGMSAEQILQFDIDLYFEELGLIKHLSPSRGNGLLAIVDKIRQIVKKS